MTDAWLLPPPAVHVTAPADESGGKWFLRYELWQDHGTDAAVLIASRDLALGPVARRVKLETTPEEAARITAWRLSVVALFGTAQTLTVEDAPQ